MFFQSKKLLGTWLIVVLYLPIAIVLIAEFQKFTGNLDDLFNFSNFFAALLILSTIVFGLLLNYTLNITDKSIEYRFFPIQFAKRQLAWNDVKAAQIVQYKPLSQFWGYGLRKNPRYGTAYILGGSVGLYVIARDGKKLLFEISDVQKLREFAQKEGLNHINFDIVPLENFDFSAFQTA